MKGGNIQIYTQNYMERCVKIRDLRDISLLAENISKIKNLET